MRLVDFVRYTGKGMGATIKGMWSEVGECASEVVNRSNSTSKKVKHGFLTFKKVIKCIIKTSILPLGLLCPSYFYLVGRASSAMDGDAFRFSRQQ